MKIYILAVSIFLSAVLVSGAIVYSATKKSAPAEDKKTETVAVAREEIIVPSVKLPVEWKDLGKKLTESGVIDFAKFEQLYASRGGLPEDVKKMLTEEVSGEITMTENNAQILLNIFWALGLGNKNVILEKGPMSDPEYGGAAGFASTGGWSFAKGNPMGHFSKHPFVALNEEQQALVENVSKGIYRPCCGNSTYFPDCNHGMAMLGMLELLASQGVSEADMYRIALQVNAHWFPDTYLTVANFLQKRGIAWKDVDPKEILGATFSSSRGYRRILMEEQPQTSGGGGSCGV